MGEKRLDSGDRGPGKKRQLHARDWAAQLLDAAIPDERIVARISLIPAEVSERGLVDRDATAKASGVPVWELGPEAVELTRRALVGS